MSRQIKGFFITLGIMIGAAALIVGIYWLFSDRGQYLTNDQIITETKKCNAAGLEANHIINGWNYKITSVQCGKAKK